MIAALGMEVASGVMLGGLAFVGLLVVLTIMQMFALMADGEAFGDALPRAAGRTYGAVGMLIAGVAFIVTGSFDVIANIVATAPFALSNLVTIVLGALGMQGYVTDTAFVVGALSFAGFTVIMREVRG